MDMATWANKIMGPQIQIVMASPLMKLETNLSWRVLESPSLCVIISENNNPKCLCILKVNTDWSKTWINILWALIAKIIYLLILFIICLIFPLFFQVGNEAHITSKEYQWNIVHLLQLIHHLIKLWCNNNRWLAQWYGKFHQL